MTKKQFIEDILPLSERMYRACFRLLNDTENARDMVQHLFCKLWDCRDKLSSLKNTEAFIMRMTRNACLDKLRIRKFTTGLDHHHPVTESSFELHESAELIKRAISDLPEKQRCIIELRDVEGFTFEAISEILDLPQNTIRVSLCIARKKVRDAVQKIYSYGT